MVGAVLITLAFAWYSRDLPDPNALMGRNVPQSTKIYDRTGETLLYEIHGDEKRTLIQLDSLPDYVVAATVAVEDKDFYKHRGISVKRILKAVYVDIIQRRKAQGASTLTQQFVKNAVLTTEKKFGRKLKEIVLALQIERLYTKDEILQLYFNEIPYGSTLYGIESAAQSYFGKPASELTLDEAALLASLPQAPDYYSPYGTGLSGDNRDKLVQRQKLILNLMAAQDYITQEQADEAKEINTLEKLQPKQIGNIHAPHFVTYVRSQLVEEYGQRAVEQGGLKVITSLDWNLQQIAEEEVAKGVEDRGEQYGFSNAALVAVDPYNGQVLSMVGSKDFFDQENDGQVNVTIRPRQPGSSFKPIVYAAGFLKGYTPEMTLWDVNTTFKTDIQNYSPKNYDLGERGPVSVRKALQGSLNIPAVKMLYLVGVSSVLDFAEQLGYTTLGDRSRFGLALVLGGGEVKLLEHTRAYATFAAEGKLAKEVTVLKVEDAEGKVLEEWEQQESRQVVDRDAILRLSNVLSDNNARAFAFGANNYLTLPGRPVAAKTGTTNDYRDAWTIGYVPSLAAGVWAGNNDNSAMRRGAGGSTLAAPIWQGFMKRAVQQLELPVEQFPAPPSLNTNKPVLLGQAFETKVKIDTLSGKLATEFTPPELIEERSFQEAHNILWYVEKNDPLGPAPSNPEKDPQFYNWESAVQDWVERTGWASTTKALPTEYDDVHTADVQPQITINSPKSNTTWNSREPFISVSINAPRRITRVEAYMEGQMISTTLDGSLSFTARVPNSIGIGYHDLKVTAIDELGSRGSATVTINLTAQPLPAGANIISPANGSTIDRGSFPNIITVTLSDLESVSRVDVFLQESQNNNTRLLASELLPESTLIQVKWNSAPLPGSYFIYPIMVMNDGSTISNNRILVNID